ncbi:MAG: hypothetical protein E6K17_08125, partial [Methanobacteriota archaeon]
MHVISATAELVPAGAARSLKLLGNEIRLNRPSSGRGKYTQLKSFSSGRSIPSITVTRERCWRPSAAVRTSVGTSGRLRIKSGIGRVETRSSYRSC